MKEIKMTEEMKARIRKQIAYTEKKLFCEHNKDIACKDCRKRLYGKISSGLFGEISSRLYGNISGLYGNISGLYGDVSGLTGDILGLSGEISSRLSGEISRG